MNRLLGLIYKDQKRQHILSHIFYHKYMDYGIWMLESYY